MKRIIIVAASVWAGAIQVAAGQSPRAEGPTAVSPGSTSRLALTGDPCPTFSWSAVGGAEGYELVVYHLGGEAEDARPVLRQRFTGSVYTWTPALDECLEPGGQYAWSVRALNARASEWSDPSLFDVALGPTRLELEAALEVVNEYLRTRDGVGAATSREAMSREAAAAEVRAVPERKADARPRPGLRPSPEPTVSPPSPATVAMPKLTVDGGVVAESFTGDGSTLTSLNADNLSSGTVPELRIADEIARDSEVVVAVVAAFAVEAACSGAYGSPDRYTDCDNGTVRDNNTGLIWLKNANCFGTRDWDQAHGDAAGLADGSCGLTDGSTAGDWRLSTASEMCSAYAGSTLLPCPADAAADSLIDSSLGVPYVSNTAGDGVWSANDPFTGVQASAYWSSTTLDGFPTVGYIARLDAGWLTTNTKTIPLYVWPVREAP
jgi:hypothetical protein